MKKLIIGIVLGVIVMIGCGDDGKSKAGICEVCNQDSDCESDLSCDELYELDTSLPVGEYCIDSPTRVCKIGEDLIGLDSQPIATASADLTSGLAPLAVNFTGSVTDGNAPFSYEWYFGDDATSTEQNPTHTYNASGTFSAVFTVTDADGDSDSDSVVIEVAPLTIELTAVPTTINADDSNAGSTITITANITGGSSVDFEVTEKPTGSAASVNPATGVTVVSGEATTELNAGTKAGEVVVTGTVGDESDEVTVTVTAGALAGIKVRDTNPIMAITCPTIGFTLTAQLADTFGNDVEQAGVSVTFSTDNGTLTTPTLTTDSNGQATTELSSLGANTAVVTATYINTVTFDPVTGGDSLLVPPTAAEIESGNPPSFRTNTFIVDPDPTDNQLGLAAPLFNADLDDAVKDGTVNMLYAASGLTKVSGENEIMFTGFTGLCGAPAGPSTTPCTGAETNYYIDPGSLDACGYPLVFTKGTVIDGALSVNLPELSLSFPVDGGTIEINLCDIDIEGTVTMTPWAIAGNKIEGTYCPGGCASLLGFLTKTELCALVDTLLEGMCDTVQSLLGDPDGECSGEEAYSIRILFAANEVTLYEVP